jgi:outer membrane protein TolC
MFIIFLYTIFLLNSNSVPKNSKKVITLKEFIKLAINRSPHIEKAKLQINRYEALLKGSKLLYLPQITISAKGAPSPKYKCVMPQDWLNAAATEGMSEEEFKEQYCVGTDRDDSITYNLDGYIFRFEINTVIPLYTFGKFEYLKAKAKAAVKGSHSGFETSIRNITYLTKKAYYAYLSVKEIKKLVLSIEKHMKKAKDKAVDYEENEKITQTDLIRLKLGMNEIARRKLEVIKLEKISEKAVEILAGYKVKFKTVSLPLPETKIPPPEKKLLSKAVKNRPEVKMLMAKRAIAQASIGLAKSAFYPDIGLFARYRLTLSNSDDPKSVYANDGLHGNSIYVGVGVTWKLSPAKMVTDLELAKIEQRKVEAQIAASRDLLKMEISKVREEVIFNIKKIKLIKKGVKLSRSWILALEGKEAIGIIKPKELVDSLVSYFKLKLSLKETYYKLHLAWLDLHRAVGNK